MNVLVAYATKHGATRGIAERIATTLEHEGLDVTLRGIHEPVDPAGYDAFVIGSAAYMGRWLKEAAEFVRHNAATLITRPVWLFSSGPIGTETVDKKGRDVFVASEPLDFAELIPLVHPRGVKVFFGAYDPEAPALGIGERLGQQFFRLMPAVRDALPAGDFRDWPAIESWARDIAREIGAVLVGAR
jgi:menaquinone-dependent protoporphyrinogen oxidase